MKHGKCPHCFRVYRSKASRELAEARSDIIADLKASAATSKHGKRERKQLASAEFRQHG